MSTKLLMIVNDETTIYNFRREILKAFHAQGYEVTLCIPVGEHTKEIEECGCTVVNINVSRHGTNPLQDLKFLFTCRRMIKRYKPDLVLTYTVKPNVYGSLACQSMNVPYINNVTGLGTILQSDSLLARLMLFLQKMGYRKSSCVFFQNEANYRALLEKGVVRKNTTVEILPGSGVNLDLHCYEKPRADDGVVRFIIVSRIREDKGYNEFFKAARIIKKKYPKTTEFHVVGWYEEEKYKKNIDELVGKNIIIFHGMQVQEEVHKLIASSDCMVLPTYHEGMANVLLEAAATGRPVIATNIPGCQEAFEEEKTGYGCEVKSVVSLVEAMEKMIATPYAERVEMGKKGRIKMENEFDRNFVAQKYIKQIERIVNGTV